MNNVPTELVTFLFTDIEGSTKLSQEFPETLQAALEKHHSIMQEAVESNNGFVFEIIGDAFCCAFANASDAVKAAYDSQTNLSKEKWDDAVIKVRMGIHSGNAEWNGKRYMGYITLARTARIMSAAYGEQIIISNDTFKLVKENFTDGRIGEIRNEGTGNEISFRDLGERRLKDVIQPIRLFQIISPGLREDFPPLKTLDARSNNLPVQLTSFIGREEEMKQVKSLLRQTHLLTLTGSGGAGKTRLSLQIAADVIDDFANGVWLVELAPLLEPAFLPRAISEALGVQEEPERALEDTLCDYLREKEILIILDNCEHLIEACSSLAEKLLSNSAKLKLIATSREALRCSGEQTHSVLSLEVPDPKDEISPEKLTQYEAARLFIERALSVNPNFRVNSENAHALAEICYQLDGIPLAIELAAARIKILSLEKIYERLNDRFNLLTGGKRTALPRQQTLRALIDWSYSLLSEKEKLLWDRLSVFAGGWTLEAAEKIFSDGKIRKEEVFELLNYLTEKSIIVFDEVKERYRMLETVRQYGEKKLNESEEQEDIPMNHLKFFMELAEEAEPKLYGTEMQSWLLKLESENGNLEKALHWSLEMKESEKGIRLAGGLGYFWQVRGHFSAGIRWLGNILDNTSSVTNYARGKALNFAGALISSQGEYKRARKLIEESLSIYRQIEDKYGMAMSLNNFGHVTFMQGKDKWALELYKECLDISIEIKDKRSIANSLRGIGNVAFNQGEHDQSNEFYEKSLTVYREIGDKRAIASVLNSLGNMPFERGKYDLACRLYEESLALNREIGDKRGTAVSLNNLGNVAFEQGDCKRSKELNEESLLIYRSIGDKRGIAVSLNNLGNVAFEQREFEQARKLYDESLSLSREIGYNAGIAMSLENLGNVAFEQREYVRTRELNEESLSLYRKIRDKRGIAVSLNNLGNVAFEDGEKERARQFYEESLVLAREIDYKLGIAFSLENLGHVRLERGEYEESWKLYEESLTLNQELGNKRHALIDIFGLTELEVINYQHKRAAMLLGIIEEMLQSMKAVLDNRELIIYNRVISDLKSKLGEGEFSKYKSDGKAMTFEQAIEFALKKDGDEHY